MADKDEFKFDDDDAFPETDLSGAFSEGEQSVVTGGEPEYPMTIKKAGGSKLKLLLGVLLVVLVAGGGAYYYFFMMNPPAPPPPPRRPVATVPKPTMVPPPAAPAAPAAGQTQVAVPPPPAKPGAPVAAPLPTAVPATATVPPPKPAVSVPPPPPAAGKPVAAPVPAAVAVAPPPKPEAKPAAAPAPAVAKPTEAKVAPQANDGPWMVEAGTYLNPADLKTAKNAIRRLGYEPKVSTRQKLVRMTRLRLGSYPAGEIDAALTRARGVAPDAFTLRSGSNVTLYAGTYADQQNVSEMSERLIGAGLQVEQEPLEVNRTISLLRFGGFASESSADKAADKARQAGIAAEVVKPR